MAARKKLTVAVLYGGRSGEHEISLLSAHSVLKNLDRQRFEVIPVGIDKTGVWRLGDLDSLLKAGDQKGVKIPQGPQVMLLPYPEGGKGRIISTQDQSVHQGVDVIFPVMHGPLCEDGSIQGLFELSDIPYVGSGVLGSAVAMDKQIAKVIVEAADIPVVPYMVTTKGTWEKNLSRLKKQVKEFLDYPVFVKPANMGSSVGVLKVKNEKDLSAALETAFEYDLKVLIEKSVEAREIELAVLENPKMDETPLVSIPGEIVPQHEFYSYEAKYLDEQGAKLMVPADLKEDQAREAQSIAVQAFNALECEGMARIDLFLDKKTNQFFFNEANTIPGFTKISMYPKLWEATGVNYSELLSKLVDLAIARRELKGNLCRDWTQK